MTTWDWAELVRRKDPNHDFESRYPIVYYWPPPGKARRDPGEGALIYQPEPEEE